MIQASYIAPVMSCIQRHVCDTTVAPRLYQYSHRFLSWNMHTMSGLRVRMGFCRFASRFPAFVVLVIGLRIVFLADESGANQGSEVIKCVGFWHSWEAACRLARLQSNFLFFFIAMQHDLLLTQHTHGKCVSVPGVISPRSPSVTWLNVLTLHLSLVSHLFNGCDKRMKLNDTCRDPDSQRL